MFSINQKTYQEGSPVGYRDDFYTIENVVGFTGNIQDNPTVYFMTEDEAGHITQVHDVEDNIGRGMVVSSKGYSMKNIYNSKKGIFQLVELIGDKIIHPSRNPFVAVPNLENRPSEKALFEKAILKFKEIKIREAWAAKQEHVKITPDMVKHLKTLEPSKYPGRSRSGAFSL